MECDVVAQLGGTQREALSEPNRASGNERCTYHLIHS
jgi:hypothetical protein